ncbi:MAG: hypothetical protein EHM65_05760 [Acidobacteriales bacterium]|nr:MAG: hypothetical protein EHM65_05760 [Terriglobales bacterium]
MQRLGREFVRHVLPQIIRPIRALWNEVIGFLFLSLAAIPIPRTFRNWQEFSETGEGFFRLALSLFFITLMAGFGIHSFFRARKISRS